MNKRIFKVSLIVVLIVILVTFSAFMIGSKLSKKNKKIELKEYNIVLKENDEKYIEVLGNNKKITYKSNNPNIVKVSDDGKIYGVSNGEATITITNGNGATIECNITVKSDVKDLILENEKIYLYKDEETDIEYTTSPESALVDKIEFNSEDTDIATVSDGHITAHAIGNTKITIRVNDKIEKYIYVEVREKLKEVNLQKKELNLYVDDKYTLKYTIEPTNATIESKKWTSSDESIVSVDKNGNLVAKEQGTAIVEITLDDKTDKCKITVEKRKPSSISLEKDTYELQEGASVKLNAKILPTQAADDKITWESSDESIVSVDSTGKINCKKIGTAYIDVSTSNGKTDRAKIIVYKKTNTRNKTAIFFGDSITQGVKSKNYSWANFIGDNYDLKSTINAGKSGWKISNATNSAWIVSVLDNYKSQKFDYVILHGGTNDISMGVKLGTYNPNDFSGKYDNNTFVGGLETYIYTAKKYWPNAKIGYIINYATPNSDDNRKNLSDEYYTIMKKVLNKWNIKYFDMFFGSTPSGIKYSKLLDVNSTKYLVDNLHLNLDGYKLISPYIYDWMNTL